MHDVKYCKSLMQSFHSCMREKKRKESKAEMEKVGQRKETLCRVLDSPIVTVNDDEFISALQLLNKRWPEVEKLL